MKFKSRYVALGNTQKAGEDYGETFGPTGKPALLKLINAIAAINRLPIHQMDAVAAFLNSLLNKEIYVEQPEGFVEAGGETKVCLLLRSLYGLKQSPKMWRDNVQAYLKETGFTQSEAGYCTYIRLDKQRNLFTAVYVHVEDLAITGNNIERFKSEVSSCWDMEDLGVAKLVVGIKFDRPSSHMYMLSQTRYALAVLERYDMSHAKPASTPFPPGLKLYRATDEQVEEFTKLKCSYRGVVGSLMYLAQCTRPDLSYAVGGLSQHLERPGMLHWEAASHVLRYLRGTVHLGITYDGKLASTVGGAESSSFPISHCDADWAVDQSTRHLTTRYVFTLAGGALSWRSRLQPTVALSFTEAEYRANTEAGQEIVWLRNMLELMGSDGPNPTVLKSENLGAIHLTTKAQFHSRTKHIEIQYHCIREVVHSGKVTLEHCPTENMVADLLTKPVGNPQFIHLRSQLGLSSMEASS